MQCPSALGYPTTAWTHPGHTLPRLCPLAVIAVLTPQAALVVVALLLPLLLPWLLEPVFAAPAPAPPRAPAGVTDCDSLL